jgi:hypothetical protein
MSDGNGSDLAPAPADLDDVVCPHLGRCDDPDNYYSFPRGGNCCCAGERPFPVRPSYQAAKCLDGDWFSCPRYRGDWTEDRTLGAAVPFWMRVRFRWVLPALAVFAVLAAIALALVVLWPQAWSSGNRPERGSTASLGTLTPVSTVVSGSDAAAGGATTSTPTETLTPTVLPSVTSSQTPTASASPTLATGSAQTSTPTSTSEPTSAPSLTPSRTPSPTPTQTPSPTLAPTGLPTNPLPSPTATGTPFPAPALLTPPDAEIFSEWDGIELSWQSIGPLPEDVYYVITVKYAHLGDTWYDETPWTKETSWRLSDHRYLLDLSDDGIFVWSVQVMRQTDLDADGKPMGLGLSPSSEVRRLTWERQNSGQTVPTPEPPPP